MYRTSAAQYGSRAPSVHTMPTSFHCRSQKFSAVRKSFHRMLTLSKLSRESYMSAHVFIEFIKQVRESDNMQHFITFSQQFLLIQKYRSMFNVRFHLSYDHITTLKWRFWHENTKICNIYVTLLRLSFHYAIYVTKICKQLVVYRF